MSTAVIHQRCWNHEAREAVCRCPECGRSFCRECVTEHDARLLCVSCLAAAARVEKARVSGLRRLLPAGMLLAGLLLAWFVFFAAGESLILITGRMEQSIGQTQ